MEKLTAKIAEKQAISITDKTVLALTEELVTLYEGYTHHQYDEIVNLLLERGADPAIITQQGSNALSYAAKAGNVFQLERLPIRI